MKPLDFYFDRIEGIQSEVMSAMSSLNMEPSPIEGSEGTYLSETDYYAKHSMEHMLAAMKMIAEVRREGARDPSFPDSISPQCLHRIIDSLAYDIMCRFDFADTMSPQGNPTLAWHELSSCAQFLKLAGDALGKAILFRDSQPKQCQ